jgi:hypothetical protein
MAVEIVNGMPIEATYFKPNMTQLIRAKNHNKVTDFKNSGHQVNSI